MRYYSENIIRDLMDNGFPSVSIFKPLEESKEEWLESTPHIEIKEPHGRLGDIDAKLKNIMETYCSKKNCENNYNGLRCKACWVDDMMSEIDSIPSAII